MFGKIVLEIIFIIIVLFVGMGVFSLAASLIVPSFNIIIYPFAWIYNKIARIQTDKLNKPINKKTEGLSTKGWRAPVDKKEDDIQIIDNLNIDSDIDKETDAYSDYGYLPLKDIYKDNKGE